MKTPRIQLSQLPTLDARRATLGLRLPASDLRSPASGSWSPFVLAVLIVGALGCTSPKAPEPIPVPPPPSAPEVIAAESLFESNQINEAIAACIDISRKNPEATGLVSLQGRITKKLAEENAANAETKLEYAAALDTADAKRFGIPPDTYRKTQHVTGENAPLRTAPSKMQKVLTTPVSVHLVNADINAIIAQIGQSENINIIADSEISPKMLTIHAEKTPLIEVLEYIGRNLNVTFSVGENLIWVTAKEEQTTGVPMATRFYRLRKGMIGSELGKSPHGVSLFKSVEDRKGASSPLQQKDDKDKKEGKVGLLEAIERFVPQPEGADFLFNDKAHALVVKNTRENLDQVENLIAAMDVRPLQILIEARFVTTDINDLRDLGVDWLYQKTEITADTTTTPVTYTKNIANTGAASLTGAEGANIVHQFLMGDRALQATLHALQSSGKSRTIIVPRVTTLNNREASFRVGEDHSYFEQVQTSIMSSNNSGVNNNSSDNVTYDYQEPTIVETGYSLLVTPSVGADLSSINLVLRPEISTIKAWEEYPLSSLSHATTNEPTLKLPILSRQYIETEAVVRSGETVVLGGLADDSKSESQSGTPWLSTLPWIGYLFKTEQKTSETKNVLIFVTATLISDAGEELIPLNETERYGVAVPADAKVPAILKNAATAPTPATPAAAPATAEPTPAVAPAAAPAPVAPAPVAPAPVP